MKGKTQKAEITRQRILDAAVDFFYEYGYEKASLQNIADQVGLTKPPFTITSGAKKKFSTRSSRNIPTNWSSP